LVAFALTVDDVAELLDALRAKGCSAKTAASALATLQRVMRFARRCGWIVADPVDGPSKFAALPCGTEPHPAEFRRYDRRETGDGVSTGNLRAGPQLLADVLDGQVDQIAERTAARMQELLPSHAMLPRGELVPVTLSNLSHLLGLIRDPDGSVSAARDVFQASADTLARQGMTSDEVLDGWRISLEVLREAADAVGAELEVGTDALLEFVDAMVRSGDMAMRACTPVDREAEVRELARLSAEQAALLRVATLAARGPPSEKLFALAAEQLARVLGVPIVRIARYEADGTANECAYHSERRELFPVGTRLSLDGTNVLAEVRSSGRPARINDHAGLPGMIAQTLRRAGIRSTVAAPILVDGQLWGAVVVCSPRSEPLPANTESRLMDFSDLLAIGISNANARAEADRLAQEQAVLRRVATMVARERTPEEVFDEVCEEVVLLRPGAEAAVIQCYEPDGTATVVGSWAAPENRDLAEMVRAGPLAVGTSSTLDDESITALVYGTERTARIDGSEHTPGSTTAAARVPGLSSSVGSPIFAEGRLWGTLVAVTNQPEPLPADAEARIAQFTELLGTAISNVQTRTEVQRLAKEQAALRRVATLVARGAPPEEVFVKVCEEVGPLLGAEAGLIDRFDADGYCTVVGSWGKLREAFPVGSRWKVEGSGGASAAVYRTGRAIRLESYEGPGSIATEARGVGLRSAVGSPIVVNGRLWASLVVAAPAAKPLPVDAEERIAQFAELVATSIANVQARSDLAASRSRLVAAADDERRRVVRDLHDGAQQRLVHTIVTVKLARSAVSRDRRQAKDLVREALEQAQTANEELRELAHGILPSTLTRGGLGPGVETLARGMSIPVEVDVRVGRLPETVEATSYFVVAEALTNVTKHAQAEEATVTARLENSTLEVEVRDDGIGGARTDSPGLVGLRDRVAAVEGRLRVDSAAGAGTVVAASIPIREAVATLQVS
jgi:signal transduction histidine kinase